MLQFRVIQHGQNLRFCLLELYPVGQFCAGEMLSPAFRRNIVRSVTQIKLYQLCILNLQKPGAFAKAFHAGGVIHLVQGSILHQRCTFQQKSVFRCVLRRGHQLMKQSYHCFMVVGCFQLRLESLQPRVIAFLRRLLV